MAHAEANITINRPINAVFDFVLDGTKNPLWRPVVVDITRVPDKPTGVGAVFKQSLKGPGRRVPTKRGHHLSSDRRPSKTYRNL